MRGRHGNVEREGKGRGGEGRGGEGRGEVRALARGVVNINCYAYILYVVDLQRLLEYIHTCHACLCTVQPVTTTS
jgi:hypothetical protein